MSNVFSQLHPSLQNSLNEKGWTATPIQEMSIPEIIEGKDRLLIAPTGSGKTLSAVLPIIHRCLDENWEPLAVLYITPLRALNRDIDRRLHDIAESVGLKVGIRHGDTTQSERTRQTRKPPHILVTTPETFQLMFTGKNLRKLLQSVRAVIIDEVHDLAASERGWQLSIGLSRLEALSGKKVQRIGLSATVGNPSEVSKWLSNHDGEPIIATGQRTTQLIVDTSLPLHEDEIGGMELALPPRAHATFREMIEIIRESPPCLLFVNSRNDAETIANRLQKMAPDVKIGVHHGSLATQTRVDMEDQLRKGELSGLVCTSSLELGIDVGKISRIIQIKSPRSVDRMLQRVGRADHRLGGIGVGNLLAWDCDEISESAVIAEKAMKHELEPVEWRKSPKSVVANQLVMMAHSFGAYPIDEATEILSNTSQFEDWTREKTEALLTVLSDGWILRFTTNPDDLPWYRWPKTVYQLAREQTKDIELPEDRPLFSVPEEEIDPKLKQIKVKVPKKYQKGWFSTAGRTRQWVTNHLSMIPDKQSYRVRDSVTRKTIGSVDEAFVLSLNDSGEDEDGTTRRFVIAGRTWMIIDADPEKSELLVVPVSDQAKAPQWVGELPPVPPDIARDIGRLRGLIAEEFEIYSSKKNDFEQEIDATQIFDRRNTTVSDYPLNDYALGMLCEEIGNHVEKTGSLPTDRRITIEERNDALMVNSCHGSKINETLGHLILAMASTKSGYWGRLIVEPTRIGLQASQVKAEDIVGWLKNTPPEALEGILSVTLPNSRQVRWRFAQVAKTFGILRHGIDPRKINLQGLLKKYRGTIVMEEVLEKLFFERMDLEGAKDVLRAIQSDLINIELTPSGPLGISRRSSRDLLLPNWDNAAVREKLKLRLTNERAVLCCLKCKSKRRFRVAKYPEIKDAKTCLKCKGRMLACSREGMEKMLESWVNSDDEGDQVRMMKNAELVQNRGYEGVLCLMARGIGEATAQRILKKVPRNNVENLLKAIHNAEIEYARTRRFWG
ncbi:MAG: DEAD/DEAH box helicase [Candidatus Poseidoniaceae archaeon]|tara:strand:+ start:11307 stop:14336 length:3030 start_codon:yes stop_codon:yes gene_type:complete